MALLDGDLNKVLRQRQRNQLLGGLAQGLLQAGSQGRGLLSGFGQGASSALQAQQGGFKDISELLTLRRQIDADKERKARGAQVSQLVGGFDPQTGVTFDTGRQGVPGEGVNSSLLSGTTEAQRGLLGTLPPEQSLGILAQREFPKPDALSPKRAQQEIDIAIAKRVPRRPTAQNAKIDEIMDTFGADRKTAAGIATGAVKVVFDPVNKQPFAVNLATGVSTALKSPPATQGEPAAQEPPAAQSTKTLFSLADETAGVVSGAKSALSGLGGQISDDLVATKTVEARQSILAAQNGLIRALSINPRFPVGEINRLREEINIAPSIFDSPESLRSRMRSIDKFLRNQLPNELSAAQDASLPVKTRQNAATAAKDIQNFLDQLGVPQEAEAPPPPPGFEVIN